MYQSYVFYLVESLATVKSIVLLLDVDDTRGERERLLQQLYGLLFDLAPLPTVPKAAKLYLLEIGQTLIDEADSISSDITAFIVQKMGDVRGETQKFAAELVRSCADKLQPALGLYFNEKVIECTGGADGDERDRKKLELLKQLHAHMAQIGKVAPSALASVVPQIEEELQASDVDLRLIAITHLASLFAAPSPDAVKMYPHLWQAWMNKMNDKASAVRIQWIKAAVELLPALDLDLRKSIQTALTEKLQDVDAKVRERAIDWLQKYVDDDKAAVLILGPVLCEEVGVRCRDTLEEVRIKALNLLGSIIVRLYERDPRHECFAACCNQLFNLIYTNERDIRIFYEYFIEHGIFIPRSGVDYRQHTELVVAMYRTLGEEAHKAFKKWLNDKSLFVRYFGAYVKVSLANPADPRLAALNQHIANLFRVPLEAQPMLQTLSTVIASNEPMKSVFNSLCSPDLSLSKHQENLKRIMEFDWDKQDRRLKHYLMTFLGRRASLLSIHPDFLKAALAIDSELQPAAQRLVAEIISEFPALGIKHSDLLEARICDHPDDVDSLLAYSRFVSACAGRLDPRPEVMSMLKELVVSGTRLQAKYSVRSLLALAPGGSAVAELVASMWSALPVESNRCVATMEAIRAWQCVNECCKANLCHRYEGWQERSTAALQLVLGGESKSHRLLSLEAPLEEYHAEEALGVVAIRALRNWILNLKTLDKEEEMKQLRVFAPLLVGLLHGLKSPRVLLAVSKTIICLVPRPTAFTIVNNLRDLVRICLEGAAAVRDALSHLIVRQYQLGNIGMIYLLAPLISAEEARGKGSLRETLISLRKNDRFADAVLPLDDATIEINSRQLRRYEDLMIMALMVAAICSPSAALDEAALQHFSSIVDLLADVIATEINVSYLFDAVVQLKRHEFVEDFSSRNKHLYILSELAQNTLRHKASTHKWLLQAIKSSIVISDDLLRELSTVEEMGRNIKKTYLVRAQERLHHHHPSKRSESMPMDIDEGAQNENINSGHDNRSSTSSSLESTPKKPVVGVRRSARNKPSVGKISPGRTDDTP